MLKNYFKCQLQAKFNYIDHIPQQTGSAAWFGSIVHEAAEALGNGASIDEAVDQFLRELAATEPDYWNQRTSYTSYKDLGQRMLREFAETSRWVDNHVIASEYRFMVDVGEHQVSGIVDSLQTPFDASTLDVIDYKTGSKPTNQNLRLDIQFCIYEWATHQEQFWTGYPGQEDKYPGLPNGADLYEAFMQVPRRTIWYDLRKNQDNVIPTHTDEDYGRMYRAMEQIARAVEKEVFVPNISGDSCGWCSYTDICPVYLPEMAVELSH